MSLRRLPHLAVIAVVLVALLPATASAKRIVRAEVCGADGCTTVRGAALVDLGDGGPPTGPPRAAAPFFTAKLTIAVGDGRRQTFTSTFVPRDGLLRADDGTWMDAPVQTETAFKRAARGLEAFPASSLRGLAPAIDVRPPAPVEDGGTPAWLLVGLGLAAALLTLAAVRFVLRRSRGSSPAAPTPPGGR